MTSSLYSDGAGRNSIVVDLAHDLSDFYGDGRRTSFPAMNASVPSNLSYYPGTSMINDSSTGVESHMRANPYRTSPESMSFNKASRGSLPPPFSSTPSARRHSAGSEGSYQSSLQAPHSSEPSGSFEGGERTPPEGSDRPSEHGSFSVLQHRTVRKAFSEGDVGHSREGSDRSMKSGAETVPWARAEASRTCVGMGGDTTDSHSDATASSSASRSSSASASFSSSSSSSSSSSASSSPRTASSRSRRPSRSVSTATTHETGTPHTRQGVSHTAVHSVSALPSALFYPTDKAFTSPTPDKTRGRTPQPPPQASRNDMSLPFIFTPDGSFGAFPSPPEEGAIPNLEDSGFALQQSAMMSEMGFSYGGPGSMSALPVGKPTGARPPSRRRSLNRANLSHMNASMLQRQSSAANSVLYSTIDNGINGAMSVSGKPMLEGTIPSTMMYYYARTPSAANPNAAAAAAAGLGLSSSQRSSSNSTSRRRHSAQDDDDGDEESHSESGSSGVTSSSPSVSENSLQQHSSFFDPDNEGKRKRRHHHDQQQQQQEQPQKSQQDGGQGGDDDEAESPPHRALFTANSAFSPGFNVRVLRGDFDYADASLDSRELARVAKKAMAASAAIPAAANTTTTTSTPAAAAAAAPAAVTGTPAKAAAPGKASPATLNTSPQGITPDSDNAHASSVRGAAGSALPTSAAETVRRRSSGNAIMNFFRGGAAHPGRSTTSMTMSSGWGTMHGPNASQQTVVGGWKLLSFRETDDAPLTNTEHVPHNDQRKKKKKKDKDKKKSKKGKKKTKERRGEDDDDDEAKGRDEEGGDKKSDAAHKSNRGEDGDNHGDVARDVANEMMRNEQQHQQQHNDGERNGEHPQHDSPKRTSGPSSPVPRSGSATGANKNATSSTAAVAMAAKAAHHTPVKEGRSASTEGGKTRPAQGSAGSHPQPWPQAPVQPTLPPVQGAAQGRMRVARLPLRSATTSTASRTASAARAATAGASAGTATVTEGEHATGHNATGGTAAAVATSTGGAPSAGGERGRNGRGVSPSPSGRTGSPSTTPRTAAAAGSTAPGTAASATAEATNSAATATGPKKPAERVERFKEAPLTSPSATVRRTTVRTTGKAKVLVNASRRVNLGAIETTATGVRRFRPNAGPRLKTVMPPSNTRTAATPHTAAAAPKGAQSGEHLPPL